MAAKRKAKSASSVRTMRELLDGRRVKSAPGALMELAALATERQRLQTEIDRWMARQVEIQARLEEIAGREAKLQTVVQGHLADAGARHAEAAVRSLSAAQPLPSYEHVGGLVTRTLDY